ncbi:hypothetical protein OAS39_04420 [Pirellulales bacterium]|nr:hypothetical protein [Pirellulales bacterium]
MSCKSAPPLKARTCRVVVAVMLCAAVGCTSGKSDDWKFAGVWAPPWSERKPEPQIPARMVTSWTHTVLHRTGETPQRGFGGRMLFFGTQSDEPIRVAGQLVVYAFDESDRQPHETQPTRRYIYPVDQFARLESDTKLGASYSVWVPWDKVGGEQKHVSLIARFEPIGGTLLLGEQTRHLLPGSGGPTPVPDKYEVQLATHQAATPVKETATHAEVQTTSTPRSTMRTTAIPLPARRTK